MITMLRIGTRSWRCVHHLTNGRLIGHRGGGVGGGGVGVGRCSRRNGVVQGLHWKSLLGWTNNKATAEQVTKNGEEAATARIVGQDRGETDDEPRRFPSSSSNSSFSSPGVHLHLDPTNSVSPSSSVPASEPASAASPPSPSPPQPSEQAQTTALRTQYDLPTYLRPYQIQVIDACMRALGRGVRRIGVSSPTGSGKTVIFTNLIPLLRNLPTPGPSTSTSTSTSTPSHTLNPPFKRPNQILILVGAIELASQAMNTIKSVFPGLNVELEQGKWRGSGKADVTVATYHSLKGKRLERYDPEDFVAVIVDEAHHAAAPSYLKLLNYFNRDVKPRRKRTVEDEMEDEINRPVSTPDSPDLYVEPVGHPTRSSGSLVPLPQTQSDEHEPGPRAAIIGFTATFSRHDQQALDTVFDEIVYHQDVWDMLQAGWLAPARFTTLKAHMALGEIPLNKSSDDFNTRALGDKVNCVEVNELVVRTWLDQAADRKSTLVFCVDLKHVDDLTNTFRAKGVDARSVSSKTVDLHRKKLIQQFKDGEFPVLLNCEILTEGTDIPNIDAIIVARPTKSRNLFSQMIGRGLRISPGKVDCRIIDMVDNVTNVEGLVSAPTLFGLDPTEDDVENASVQDLQERGTEAKAKRAEEEMQLRKRAMADMITFEENNNPFRFSKRDEIDRKLKSTIAWVRCGEDKYVLEALGHGLFTIVKEHKRWHVRYAMSLPKELVEMGRSKAPYGKINIVGRTDSFDHAIKMADAYLQRKVSQGVLSQLKWWAKWRSEPASEGQKKYLRARLKKKDSEAEQARFVEDENGSDKFDSMTRGKAASLLTALKHGAQGEAARLTKQESVQERRKAKAALKAAARLAAETIKVGKLRRS